MKKKLTNNWSLKIISALLAIVLWAVIVNINDPLDFKKLNIDVEILNGDVLNNAGISYDIGNTKVQVLAYSRKADLKNISESDIKLTADLNTLWPANGTIKIQVEYNKSIIEKVELQKDTLQVKTENLQTKEFSIVLHTTGSPADGYISGEYEITPSTIKIRGPESVIGQINSVGVQADISGATEDIVDSGAPVLYDANGNQLKGLNEKLTFYREELNYSIRILKAKEINLIFAVNGIPADGYRYLGLEASVQSIAVAGTNELISQLEYITITEDALSVAGATANATVAIDLQKYIPQGVTVMRPENLNITVLLKVQALAQKTFVVKPIQIDLLNRNADYTYEVTFGEHTEIQVIVEGLKGELDILEEGVLFPHLDVKDMSPGVYEYPILFNLPESYRIVNAPKMIITISDPNQTTVSSETSEEATSATEDSSKEIQD